MTHDGRPAVPPAERHAERSTGTAVAVDPPRVAFIERAHQRSAALGLTRAQRREHTPMIRSDLAVARERNRRLYAHAAPVMQLLFEQIVDTESMIVLTDAQGTILHSVGDDDFLARADKVALAPGENWAEHSKGTNAIGTALFEGVPTLVHANEHFIHANHFLTCSATPIVDPRGETLGVLDVTGDHRSYHQHTMALVRLSARMIENQWLSDDCNHRLRLHFHGRVEFIGTLLEGIVVVGPDGRILGANRSALDQLKMGSAQLRMQSVVSLFGTTPSAIHDHFRMPMAPPMHLSLADGREVHISARFDWPSRAVFGGTLRDDGETARTPAPTPPTPLDPAAAGALSASGRGGDAGASPFSGLQYLRTGDPKLDVLVQKIRRVIDRDIPLLILGETGTGKELLARAVHHDSKRAKKPFVAVNCASIPESLIEAELFGYEEGAFTGARRKGAPGRIQQADGGTLFLDEIGDMPLPLQARLLRVLQERCVMPLGSTKAVPVDLVVIGATHRDLRAMIEQQTFREDLYYRLNGLALRLPALRERTDLDAIVRRILQAERPHDTPVLAAGVQALFRRYRWPGNVRQLANVLRTAAVMSAGEPEITVEHLSDDFVEDTRVDALAARAEPVGGASVVAERSVAEAHVALAAMSPSAVPPSEGSPSAGSPADQAPDEPPATTGAPASPIAAPPATTLEQASLEMIRQALEAAGGNISAASKHLGISRNTIYRKLRWNAVEAEQPD